MKSGSRLLLASVLIGASAFSVGCGKTTAARVQLANITPASAMSRLGMAPSTRSAPGYLGMKIIAIYLGNTLSSSGTVPSETTLWFHPDCLVPAGEGDGSVSLDGTKEAHIARCGIEKGGTASNTEASTVDKQVQSYINLAQPTADVNAQLAAYALTVRPGTYRYVGIAMSDPGNAAEGTQTDEDGDHAIGTVPSVKFWHSSMGGSLDATTGKPTLANTVRYKASTMWYQELTEAVTINEGDSVDFTISYDLSQSYWNGDSCADTHSGVSYSHCSSTQLGSKNHFIQLPAITVSVTSTSF